MQRDHHFPSVRLPALIGPRWQCARSSQHLTACCHPCDMVTGKLESFAYVIELGQGALCDHNMALRKHLVVSAVLFGEAAFHIRRMKGDEREQLQQSGQEAVSVRIGRAVRSKHLLHAEFNSSPESAPQPRIIIRLHLVLGWIPVRDVLHRCRQSQRVRQIKEVDEIEVHGVLPVFRVLNTNAVVRDSRRPVGSKSAQSVNAD